MTPKEKADDLLDKMYSVDLNDDSDDVSIDYFHAKKCALIAADETLKALHFNVWTNVEEVNYWKEVKQHIEQL
jgi:hypothetical protein